MSEVLTVDSDHAHPAIGAGWIKANLLGALANAAAALGSFGLSEALAIKAPDTGTAKLIGYFVVVTSLVTLGYVVLSYLTAKVLARKLPAFKAPRWIALYAVVGILLGIATAFALRVPAAAPISHVWEFFYVAIFGTMIMAAIVGAAIGAVQALVLRHAARGLGAWIGFSALAAMGWVFVSLTMIYGPQAGLAREIANQAALLSLSLISAFIMLPAVLRLRPR